MPQLRTPLLLLAALLLNACVWPEPAPGEPVPTLAVTSDWSATDETITLTIEVTHLVPKAVRLYAKGLNGTLVIEDTTPPFSITFDTTEFALGDHDMLLLAFDDATIVGEKETVSIHGCNGFAELCDRSYAQVRYATTHNAMSSAEDGWIGPNQTLDVPAQLEAGVRGLMLDTYRAGSTNLLGQVQVPDADPDSPWLCHSVCALGKQPLVDGLVEIRQFLDANPGEVITLILESYLSHALTAQAFDDAALTPYAYTHPGGAWPTLGEMIDSGKRLVVLQDRSANPLYPWQMNVWSHAFETHFSAATPADFSCAHNRGTPTNALFIFNHFLTEVFGSPTLAEQVNFNPYLRSRIDECEAFQGAVANFVTIDFVSIGDTLETVNDLNGVGGF